MTDKKKKSLIFKIAVFIGGFFVLIILAISILLIITADISTEELGPSPFKVDDFFTSENNEEYKTIVEMGKSIKGNDKFQEDFELNLKDPQPSILLLEEFLKANDGIIEKVDIELFRNCKFPKPKKEDPNLGYIQDLLNLIQTRITFHILTKNFDKTKQDLLLINNINQELMKKPTGFISGVILLASKTNEINKIQLSINNSNFTIEQKIEILSIDQPQITSQILKTISHFEIEYFHWSMQEYNTPSSAQQHMFSGVQYYPIFTPFFCQPNKSAKLYRELAIDIIAQLEASNYLAFEYINKDKNFIPEYSQFIKGNLGGKLVVGITRTIYQIFTSKLLTYKSMRQQLIIAQKLLLHKNKTGTLPSSLTELNLEKEFYTDIHTGDSFLYSSQNGILQSIGKDKENCNIELTETDLTAEEIETILTEDLKDFILYLK